MMTGKPKTRLSERLNADLEQIRAEHTALMQLSLETFRHDLQTTAQDAQNTIETDIRSFLHWSGMAWSDQLMKIRRLIWRAMISHSNTLKIRMPRLAVNVPV